MKKLFIPCITALLLVAPVAGCQRPAAAPIPNLDEVQKSIGYFLAPTYLPEGFEFHLSEVIGPYEPIANVVYRSLNHHIFVMYPQELPPPWGTVSLLWERLGLDWQRPEDAASIVKVNGKPAYLIRGMWSADTLKQLEKPDLEKLRNFTPEWDYDFSLSLYFGYELSDGNTVIVLLRAMFYPAEWITIEEMVKIAESLRQLD